MKDVYIVLSRSHTILARAIRIFTKKYYNHTSVSFDLSLEPFYSFGRRNPKYMFPAGFIIEGVRSGFFGLHPDTKICVLKTQVTDEEYDLMQKRLQPFIKEPLKYKYGVLQLFYMMFNINYTPKTQYVCSVFVASLFRGILDFDRDYTKMYPEDFYQFNFEKIFEGDAGDYNL